MRDIASKIVGNSYPPEIYNSMRSELQNAVESTDQTLDAEGGPDTDLDMLGKSLALYGSAADFYSDGGSANTYVLTRSTNLKATHAYKDGMLVVWKAVAANTGASTINVNSIGVVALVDEYNIALIGDEISTVFYNQARYSSSTSKFHIVTVSMDTLKISRAQFAYVSTTQLSISGGAYSHFGSTSQILLINSTITHTITSPGTSQYQYIYLDDSAIVSAGTKIISGSEIINSTTAPTYSVTKKGWYNGEDQCIFAVYINSSGEVSNFQHDGDLSLSLEPFQVSSAGVPFNSRTTVTLVLPSFVRKAQVNVTIGGASGDGLFYWLSSEAASISDRYPLFQIDGTTHQSGYGNGGTFVVMTNSSHEFDYYSNVAVTNAFTNVAGWYFPVQM